MEKPPKEIFFKSRKIELKPNNKQRTLFCKHAGVARHAWNWGLSICNEILKKRTEEKKKGKIKTKFPSAIDLHKRLVAEVKPKCPWYYEISKCSPQQALRNLIKSFKRRLNVSGSGFPKFKKKNGRNSFYLEYPSSFLKIKRKRIKLPVIGWISCKEDLPNSIIKSVTISERAGRWFMSFKIEVTKPKPVTATDVIGVDLGISTWAVLSDGRFNTTQRRFRNIEQRIARIQRQIARRIKKSKRQERSKQKLRRLYYRQFCLRIDATHKLTTDLAKNHGVIVIEDLGVRGMMKNHHLAASIAAIGYFEIQRQLNYKCEFYGSRLVVVDRFFPSSQLCSVCGHRQKMPLSARVYKCPKCGLIINRDLNAAKNLAGSLPVTSSMESRGSCLSNKTGAGIATRRKHKLAAKAGT